MKASRLSVLFIVAFGVIFSVNVAFASQISFNPSVSFNAPGTYYGPADEYTTVYASAYGWGSFSFSQTYTEPTLLTINLYVVIGSDSLGGMGTTSWDYYLHNLTPGTYNFGAKTATADALVWLTESEPIKYSVVNANMNYNVIGPGPYEWDQVIFNGSPVTAAVTGTIVPEPVSSTLFIIGGATLGFRRLRKRVS